ncbi:MAG TPA: hypothetical protein VK633_15940, partial [Verrucomicrobiae bacterium]|nr:hypothetical protein [Verrucomicrobiae bacterium]
RAHAVHLAEDMVNVEIHFREHFLLSWTCCPAWVTRSRTAASRAGCSQCALWPPSLSFLHTLGVCV